MSQPPHDPQIEKTPQEVADELAAGGVQLVDVREPQEWDAGRIAQARHVPLDRLSAEAASIDRERPVVFQCHSGARSLMAAQAFQQAGYDAWSMAGGIAAWEQQGLPVDGDVAH
ncbi:MAG TPA: rhodanese-like domain-containing protein [Baekduia sp.]|nr:rhodanese-like domain-containing protein [Baekduia sp.]